MQGKRAFMVLGAILVMVLGGIGAYAFFNAGHEETDDAVVEADVIAVTARVNGVVSKVLVQDNQPVKKGDVILQLDDADLSARLAQARAELQTAKAQSSGARAQERVVAATASGGLRGAEAQLTGAQAAVQNADAQIVAARATLTRARAEVAKAERDLARARQLVESDAIARRDLDSAQLANDAAQAAVQQALANITAAEEARRASESRVAEARARLAQSAPVDQQIAAAQSDSEFADARVAAAEAAVRLAEIQFSYTKVVAPSDGVVTQLHAREGGLVGAGQPLAQLVPNQTYIVANFKETQIHQMHPGDHAEVTIDAFPGRTFDAKVESLAGGTGSRFSVIPPDNASGNFVKVVQRVPVRLIWEHAPDVPMRAGLSAVVDVTVSSGSASR